MAIGPAWTETRSCPTINLRTSLALLATSISISQGQVLTDEELVCQFESFEGMPFKGGEMSPVKNNGWWWQSLALKRGHPGAREGFAIGVYCKKTWERCQGLLVNERRSCANKVVSLHHWSRQFTVFED